MEHPPINSKSLNCNEHFKKKPSSLHSESPVPFLYNDDPNYIKGSRENLVCYGNSLGNSLTVMTADCQNSRSRSPTPGSRFLGRLEKRKEHFYYQMECPPVKDGEEAVGISQMTRAIGGSIRRGRHPATATPPTNLNNKTVGGVNGGLWAKPPAGRCRTELTVVCNDGPHIDSVANGGDNKLDIKEGLISEEDSVLKSNPILLNSINKTDSLNTEESSQLGDGDSVKIRSSESEQDGELSIKYEKALRDIDQLKEQLNILHSEKDKECELNHTSVDENVVSLQANIDRLQGQISISDSQSQKLRSDLEISQDQLANTHRQCVELEEKIESSELQLNELRTSLEEEKTARLQVTKERDRTVMEKEATFEDLKQSKLEVLSLQHKNQDLAGSITRLYASANDTLKLSEDLSNLRRSNGDLEAQLQKATLQLEEQRDLSAELEEEKLHMVGQLQRVKKAHNRELMDQEEEKEMLRLKLSRQVKELEGLLEEEKEGRRTAENLTRKLERQLEKVKDDSDNEDDDDRDTLLARETQLNKDLKLVQNHLETCRLEFEQYRSENNQESFNSKLTLINEKLSIVENEKLTISNENDIFRKKIVTLNDELEQTKALLKQSSKERTSLSSKLTTSNCKLQEIQETMTSKQSTATDRINAQSRELESLRSGGETDRLKMQELRRRLESSESQLAVEQVRFKERLKSLEGKLKKEKDLSQTLKDRLDTLQVENDSQLDTKEEYDKQIYSFKRQLRDTRKELELAQNQSFESDRRLRLMQQENLHGIEDCDLYYGSLERRNEGRWGRENNFQRAGSVSTLTNRRYDDEIGDDESMIARQSKLLERADSLLQDRPSRASSRSYSSLYYSSQTSPMSLDSAMGNTNSLNASSNSSTFSQMSTPTNLSTVDLLSPQPDNQLGLTSAPVLQLLTVRESHL